MKDFTRRLNIINRDVSKLICLEIHKYYTGVLIKEFTELFYYVDNVGLCDLNVNKRYNWRNLQNDSYRKFVGSPIYSEMMFVGKVSGASESECIKNRYLPAKYTYSINRNDTRL